MTDKAASGRVSLKEKLAAKRSEEAGEVAVTEKGEWFVLHTYSGYENKVKKSIESRVDALDLHDRVFGSSCPRRTRSRFAAVSGTPCSARSFPAMSWCA